MNIQRAQLCPNLIVKFSYDWETSKQWDSMVITEYEAEKWKPGKIKQFINY